MIAARVTAVRVGSPSKLPLHALSNVLLGAALGLLAYWGVTNAINGLDQSALRAQLQPAARGVAVRDSASYSMDFADWESQDRASWAALKEGDAFGRLVVPKMGLDTVVVKGTAPQDLRKGPGWIVTTSLPGPEGNVGISGHRTTYGHPFGRLAELAQGDTIDLYSAFRRYRYEVVRLFVVTPDRVDVVGFTPEPMLTLTACHPPFSASQRLIAQAKLVDVRPVEAGAPAK